MNLEGLGGKGPGGIGGTIVPAQPTFKSPVIPPDNVEADQQQQREHFIATYKALFDIAALVMKMSLLLNGGSLITLVTLVGTLAGRGYSVGQAVSHLQWSFFVLIAGLILVGAGAAVGYISQLKLFQAVKNPASKSLERRADCWLYTAMGLVALSLIAFAVGIVCAAFGLMSLEPTLPSIPMQPPAGITK